MRRVLLAALVWLMLGAGPAAPAGIDDARRSLADGRPADALALLETVSPDAVGDASQLVFLRSLALIDLGRPEDAIPGLQSLLARRPELVRVRLELARAYFEAGQDRRATRQFRQVLGGDLPPAVRANVLAFLERIRRRETWSGSFRAALAPDTNISTGTDDERITLFGQSFELDERARRSSGVGIEVAGTLRRSFGAPADRTRPRISGGLFLRDYANDEFDDYNISLGAGVERRIRLGSLYAGPSVSRRHFAGAPLSHSVGLEGRAQKRLRPRLLGFASLLAGRRFGLNDNDDEDAYFLSARGGLSRPLGPRLSLSGVLGVRREDAAADEDSYVRLSGDVLIGAEMPYGFRLTGGPGLYAQFHDAENPLFDARENRIGYRARIGVTNRLISYRGFSPSASVQLSRQTSDIALFDYDRARLLLGIESTF